MLRAGEHADVALAKLSKQVAVLTLTLSLTAFSHLRHQHLFQDADRQRRVMCPGHRDAGERLPVNPEKADVHRARFDAEFEVHRATSAPHQVCRVERVFPSELWHLSGLCVPLLRRQLLGAPLLRDLLPLMEKR